MNPSEQMKKVRRNFGIGEVDGGSQERPDASNLVKAEATARAGGLGGAGVFGMAWPRRCLRGDPTQSLTKSAKSSTKARPSLQMTRFYFSRCIS